MTEDQRIEKTRLWVLIARTYKEWGHDADACECMQEACDLLSEEGEEGEGEEGEEDCVDDELSEVLSESVSSEMPPSVVDAIDDDGEMDQLEVTKAVLRIGDAYGR